jgi:hypothetical protein
MDGSAFDAILNVGLEVRDDPVWIIVSSDGWLARIATAATGAMTLPQLREPDNPLGALAAACLGTGQVFFSLVGRPLLTVPIEFSLYSLEAGHLGTLTQGPVLSDDLTIDALLVGCGGVANGWTYAIKRLPITGRTEAVDHQALRGPYEGLKPLSIGAA